MYTLDKAEHLVEYYTIKLKDQDITVKPSNGIPYEIRNVFSDVNGDGTFSVYCLCNEGDDTLKLKDIATVAKDCRLLSPSQV